MNKKSILLSELKPGDCFSTKYTNVYIVTNAYLTENGIDKRTVVNLLTGKIYAFEVISKVYREEINF